MEMDMLPFAFCMLFCFMQVITLGRISHACSRITVLFLAPFYSSTFLVHSSTPA